MGEVVSLDDYRDGPFRVTREKCVACGHGQLAVVPDEAWKMMLDGRGTQCSACGLMACLIDDLANAEDATNGD